MVDNSILERYLSTLLQGNREQCRRIIEESLQTGTLANSVYTDIIWPIMVEIEKLSRAGQITPAQEHLATRINRTIVDQLQNKLPRKSSKNKKMAICCAEHELQELGAQMVADLFESDGWEVKLLGGGLTNDDILSFANEYSPDILLIYGTEPKQAPGIRQLIDTVKGINAWPNMKIMLSGGLFNRAEGLWEEIGADMFAATAVEALQIASQEQPSAESAVKAATMRRKKKIQGIVNKAVAQVTADETELINV
jgi:methanogenic corrinoid protein MtbC1